MNKIKLICILVTTLTLANGVVTSSNPVKKVKAVSKVQKVNTGLYKSNDESLIQIGNTTANGFILLHAENQYAPECSLVKSLPFKRIAPNLYIWSKDECQMIFTRFTNNSLSLTVNNLDKCFTQYDVDQPFTCFGNPMTEQQGNFIAGHIYRLDQNPNDNISNY